MYNTVLLMNIAVNVSCGVNKFDPMQIRYYGLAYEVYTMRNGAIGCASVNERPYEHSIHNVKEKSCLAQVIKIL